MKIIIFLNYFPLPYKQKKKKMGSVRYANGEYAAEQPQGLPAVIAELTRWAAQNLELTFQSEINVGSRLSEKRKLKRRITKKCNTKGANQALARRKKRINQNGDREGRRKRDFRACKKSSKQQWSAVARLLVIEGVGVPLSKTYI